MIYTNPGASFEFAFDLGQTGLTPGVQITDGAGNVTTARTTTGIVESPASSGIYTATRTAPSTAGQYSVVADNGTQTPGNYVSEDLFVTSTETPPWTGGFISVADLGTYIGEDLSASDKAVMSVNAASDMVRTFTEKTLNPVGTATISLDGTGTDALLLPERPVLSAGTVIESGGTLVLDTDYELSDNRILYRLPGVIDNGWGNETLRTYWWPGRQNIEVTYEYGYTDVPDDLKQVALCMAARLQQRSSGVIYETLGQYSVRYGDTASDFTNTERIVLRKYRA